MLDATNSRLYRSRPTKYKVAHLRWEAAEYLLARGLQRFEGPHMQVIDSEACYGVDLAVFFATHYAVPNLQHHYVKVVQVRAALVLAPFTLVTLVRGTVEMLADVVVGDFLIQNPGGELYSMPSEQFHQRYEEVLEN